MSSLLKNSRFRTAFAIWWFSWAILHAIVLHELNLTWRAAVIDSAISNILLGGSALLVAVTLQFYIPQNNRYGYLLGLCAVLTIIWLFISRGIVNAILSDTEKSGFVRESLLIRGAIGILIIGCMGLISVLWYTMNDHQESEKRKSEADQLSKDAELNSIRQQLQPHFLFNSLNSINALIGTRPNEARTMIEQLSDFLRGTMKKDQSHWVSLEEELQHLQLYLDIEKVRFGHRLTSSVLNTAEGTQLPPLLLQPIVENAIKFGLYDTSEPVTITIDAKKSDGHLVVGISNPFNPEYTAPRSGTGFGLKSVKRRLYLLFGRNDLVHTTSVNNIFTTTIKIPQS